MKRLDWVDAARGIGILAVVMGHTLTGATHLSIYSWHIPLFYFLSGFVYRTQDSFSAYAKHRARQLLVPYAIWLAIVMLPTALGELRHHDFAALENRARVYLFGGAMLGGPTGPLWFLTSLYLALVAYDALSRWSGRWIHAACVASFVLACLRGLLIPQTNFPWNADSILIAVPFIHIGHLARHFEWAESRNALAAGACVFLMATAALATGHAVPGYDIHNNDYGAPGLSFVVALGGIAIVLLLARAAGALTRPLAFVGRASLLIVSIHTAILTFLSRAVHIALPWEFYFFVCAAVPIALYPVLRRGSWSRRFLLGESTAERPAIAAPATEPPERNPLSDAVAEP